MRVRCVTIQTRYGDFLTYGDSDLISNSLRLYGEWAQKEIDILLRFVRRGDIVVDAGAYIGTHTRAFSISVGSSGQVFSFEPNPESYKLLVAGLELDNISNVVAERVALGNHNGVAYISATIADNGGASWIDYTDKIGPETSVKKLDDFIFSHLDFLKADVEGGELEVLQGGLVSIRKHKPTIFLETNTAAHANTLLKWATSEQYLCFGVLSEAFNPDNFLGCSDNIFGDAKECGMLLLHRGDFESISIATNLDLPRIQDIDDIVVLLMNKPQYPREALTGRAISRILGTRFPCQSCMSYEAHVEQLDRDNGKLRDEVLSVTQTLSDTLDRASEEREVFRKSRVQMLEQIESYALEIRELSREQAACEAELSETKRALDGHEQIRATMQGEYDALVDELKKVMGSTSWRWTAPLRLIGRQARKSAGKIREGLSLWRDVASNVGIVRSEIMRYGIGGTYRRIPYYYANRRRISQRLRSQPISQNLFLGINSGDSAQRPARIHPDIDGAVKDHTANVSVVIPALNGGDELVRLIRKLQSQKGIPDLQIVIVDSGSSDGSKEQAVRLGCDVLEMKREEFSHSASRNLGASIARNEFILFMVQDAYPVGDYWIFGLLDFLVSHSGEGVAAVSCSEYSRSDSDVMYDSMIDTHYRFLGCREKDRVGRYLTEDHMSLRSNGQLSDVACLISKGVFDAYKYRGNYAEDLDLGIRLIKDGMKTAMLSSVKVVHSHNRPPYYYLKRSFVDVIFLTEIFDDFEGPKINLNAHELADEFKALAQELSNWLECWAPRQGAYGATEEELSRAIRTFRRAARSMADNRETYLGDELLDGFLEKIREKCLTFNSLNVSVPQRGIVTDTFIGRLKHFSDYVARVYPYLDEDVERSIRNAVVKIYAATVGSLLGFVYDEDRTQPSERRRFRDEFWSELKEGI